MMAKARRFLLSILRQEETMPGGFQELQTPAKSMRAGAAQTGPCRCPPLRHIG